MVDSDLFDLLVVPEDGAVDEFASEAARPAFAMGVRTGVLWMLGPSVWKISSKLPMNSLARSLQSVRVVEPIGVA